METLELKTKLTEKQEKEFIKYCERYPNTYYFDYRDEIGEDILEKCIDEKSLWPAFCEVDEWFLNSDYDYETEYLKHVLSELSIDSEEYDLYELREEYAEYLYITYDIKDVLKPLNVKIVLHSNYDCLNSHWLESQGGYEYDGYVKQIIDFLYLNPAEVKKTFVSRNIDCVGKWPNLKYRNGKEYIEYLAFAEEFENSCGSANNWSFLAKLDVENYVNSKDFSFTIPKGNWSGLLDSTYGSGSLLECELKRDLKITKRQYGQTEYDTISIQTDTGRMSVQSIYGIDDSFFGNELY